MKRAGPPGSADLVAVVALAVIGLAASVAVSSWLRTAALLPLVLAVPGTRFAIYDTSGVTQP